MVEKIFHKGVLIALILRSEFDREGIQFFTPEDFSQQLGYMRRAKGYIVKPHVHQPILREVHYTKEVLLIRKGRVRVDFYDNDKNYLESRILKQNDVCLLAYCGHGIEVIEEAIIIEIKQGPYIGNDDKVRFEPVDRKYLQIKGEKKI